jgi:hypothetical protein
VVIKPRTAAALNGHQGHSFVVLHLCTWMPDTVQTALHPLRRKRTQIKPLVDT